MVTVQSEQKKYSFSAQVPFNSLGILSLNLHVQKEIVINFTEFEAVSI